MYSINTWTNYWMHARTYDLSGASCGFSGICDANVGGQRVKACQWRHASSIDLQPSTYGYSSLAADKSLTSNADRSVKQHLAAPQLLPVIDCLIALTCVGIGIWQRAIRIGFQACSWCKSVRPVPGSLSPSGVWCSDEDRPAMHDACKPPIQASGNAFGKR